MRIAGPTAQFVCCSPVNFSGNLAQGIRRTQNKKKAKKKKNKKKKKKTKKQKKSYYCLLDTKLVSLGTMQCPFLRRIVQYISFKVGQGVLQRPRKKISMDGFSSISFTPLTPGWFFLSRPHGNNRREREDSRSKDRSQSPLCLLELLEAESSYPGGCLIEFQWNVGTLRRHWPSYYCCFNSLAKLYTICTLGKCSQVGIELNSFVLHNSR